MKRPYHHGTLRDALLDEAQLLLAEQGSAAVSLRELARRAGVSHSAPERHFANRQALLDAVAARGFTLLAEAIRQALADRGDRLEDRFRAAAEAYVRFALDNAALLELMFASKADRTDEAIATAAADLFSLTAELVGESQEDTTLTAVSPLRLVVVATLQGIANLAAARRIQPGQVDEVIDQAVAVFAPLLAPRERPSRAE
ncbi:MAG TPA: TetR/AcrR family transcriptional regulator [Trebonia sp.]|nr:TetR/AcrR family transcriptional regulator [Trebonia sp.]